MTRLNLLRIAAIVLVLAMTATAQAAILKIATLSPDGSSWMQKMREGADKVATATENRVRFKFYPGGVMGNDQAVLRKIRIGQLHGGMFTPSSVADVYPNMQLYGMPLVFSSMGEVEYVRERMDSLLISGLEEAGLVSFGFSDGGFARVLSNTPITSVESLKGRKVWVPEGDLITYNTMSALGLSPVTLSVTDVMTGLQTGLVEIVGSSPVGAVVMQWHTKVKYMTDFPLAYLMGFMVVDKKYFDKLSDADQQVVREVFGKVYAEFDRQNKLDDSAAFKALVDSGIEIVRPDEQQIENWRALVGASNLEMADRGVISRELLDKMLGYIDEYRQSQAGAN